MNDPRHEAPRDDAPITQWVSAFLAGNRDCENRLFSHIYQELRGVAEREWRRSPPGGTLSPTALIGHAYERLRSQAGAWRPADRRHFYAIFGRVVRQVICDYWRTRKADKRGGGAPQTSLEECDAVDLENAGTRLESLEQEVALTAAFDRLLSTHPEHAAVVNLKYYCGRTVEEIAEIVGTSSRTIGRQWEVARALLLEYLDDKGAARGEGDP
ncbi:MAG: hypothetical protein FLDDKLPJ_02948 [Phycisphaerae bacterium]|nr:hypothetical protein [Phycisphaerae bacterium]